MEKAINGKEKIGMILPITLLAYFLILMDNSIIFTSSVQIGRSLNLTDTSLTWISNAYTLTFGGFLLLSGRLSDLFGRKRIFQVGLAIFGFSSLAIGFSQSSQVMILARAIEGIGSSIIAPTTLALIMDSYSGEMRTKAISYYGATAGIGSSIGLVVGGALTSFISWRAGFLINLPFSILLIILTRINVKDSGGSKEKIDYLGSFMSVIGMSLFIYGITAKNHGTVLLVSGIVILSLFFIYENRIIHPIMPPTLFESKMRFGAYLVRGLFMMSMLPYWFMLPQRLQAEYGFSALGSGIAFLPMTIITFITALQLPRLTKKYGNSKVLLLGEIILLAGLIWAGVSDFRNGYFLAVALPMIPLGVGQAMIVAPVTSAGIYKTPSDLAGSASGLTNTMHQLGGPVGLSLIFSITSDFNKGVFMMGVFVFIALVITYFFIFRGEEVVKSQGIGNIAMK